MRLTDLNLLGDAASVAALANVVDHSPWIAEAAIASRPFSSVEALHEAMTAAVKRAPSERQLTLLRAHPELAGKAAIRGELTRESTHEQSGAGLDQCSPDELARLDDLNARYREKFGFPFILAVKGYDRAGILDEFARRVERNRDDELREALSQVERIMRFRLEALFESA